MSRSSSVFTSANPEFFESLHRQYLRDPNSVDPTWRLVFEAVDDLGGRGSPADGEAASRHRLLAEAFRNWGHLFAGIDPLAPPADFAKVAAVMASLAGLSDAPVDSAGPLAASLCRQYAGALAVETSHIDDPLVRAWLVAAMENAAQPQPSERAAALALLVKAEEFERFLSVKHPTKKRFGAEGAEAIVPLLAKIIQQAAAAQVSEIVIGAMHRGRYNVLAHVLGEPMVALLAKIRGVHPFPVDDPVIADVPYHLGLHRMVQTPAGEVSVRLLPNPSHLEAINCVALGLARARQDSGQGDKARVLGVVLHTDASVIGQGGVAEMIQLSGLAGFATAGTVHVIVNNQIGFTTEIAEARTSRHCTGAWKTIDSAIFHVNGNDPDAVLTAAKLAVAFRQEQKRDAVIDLVCYRRNGHNELDEPRFTQPLLYRIIDKMPGVARLYGDRLIASGVVAADFAAALAQSYRGELQTAYASADEFRVNRSGFPDGPWSPYRPVAGGRIDEPKTGVAPARLRSLLDRLSEIPEGFAADAKAARLVRQRAETADKGIPWAVAEALAFATLLTEGVPVRLSGQDAMRGTFSHRHFALVDTRSGQRHIHLNHLAAGQAHFDVVNSPLSEYGVLGFEYGYSLDSPDRLVIWEAQFGDFANGAQIVLDHFVVNGEEKWLQPSGLVLLLPHGLEGQGPEHSSARIERLLQLAAKDNIVIANPSTPANYFHLLRRQMLRKLRRPLLITAPKTLLRHPAALSPIDDLGESALFAPVIVSRPRLSVARVLLCTGKIAYDLEKERAEAKAEDTAILRLEMLYPLPEAALHDLFRTWPEAEYRWVQEEPANMGAWSYLDRRLETLLTRAGAKNPRVAYIGRAESPSAAGSFPGDHERHQHDIARAAFRS